MVCDVSKSPPKRLGHRCSCGHVSVISNGGTRHRRYTVRQSRPPYAYLRVTHCSEARTWLLLNHVPHTCHTRVIQVCDGRVGQWDYDTWHKPSGTCHTVPLWARLVTFVYVECMYDLICTRHLRCTLHRHLARIYPRFIGIECDLTT